jgi:tetratricopeptide (TPR) repeat protein
MGEIFVANFMYRSPWFLTAALLGTTAALVQPAIIAQAANFQSTTVGRIAKAITIEIKGVGTNKIGSGILLQRQDNVYTVLTAGHVVNRGAAFTFKTSDGNIHQSIAGSVRLASSKVDLAIVKFRSNNNYQLATLGTSNSLEIGSPIYVAGFPEASYAIEAGTLNFTEGKIIGNATQGNDQGYSLIYSNNTFRGMSGGPVLNEAGQLIAIHGQGDRDGPAGAGAKTGRNLGIVIERFGNVAAGMGIKLDRSFAIIPSGQTRNASDYFLSGNNKFDAGNYSGALADYNQAIILNPKYAEIYYNRAILKYTKLTDIPGTLADYNRAISLKPQYSDAYNNRGVLKYAKLNDFQGAFADYNQAIALDPKNSDAYNNRGVLKYDKLNDTSGALADYNQAIALDPKLANAYFNRANLKTDQLNDPTGALADYNRAIAINPKYTEAYNNRANLKENKLNDIPGALADYNQAILINPKFFDAYNNRGVLKYAKLSDFPGALADYNRAIALNPKYAEAYYNRGILRAYKLSDKIGGIQDFRQAAQLFRAQGQTENLANTLQALQTLGATE